VSRTGYEILSLDDLDQYPSTTGSQILLPLRRRLGFQPFGVNTWLGREPGDHVIERHRETGGPEELYVVLRGRASFTLGDETFEAPVGTLVHAQPGTLREATALEPGTIVLAAGNKAGETFTPSPWEDFHVAFALQARGDEAGGRVAMEEALARDPDAWQGPYNAACFEARAGRADEAFELLRVAVGRGGADVKALADDDPDFDALREDERYRDL
jgi:hypothetical protein